MYILLRNMSNDESIVTNFYQLLIDIAKPYDTINKMIKKSLSMKKKNENINEIKLFDCAIAFQLLIKNKDDNNLKEISNHIFQETLEKLSSDDEIKNIH